MLSQAVCIIVQYGRTAVQLYGSTGGYQSTSTAYGTVLPYYSTDTNRYAVGTVLNLVLKYGDQSVPGTKFSSRLDPVPLEALVPVQ